MDYRKISAKLIIGKFNNCNTIIKAKMFKLIAFFVLAHVTNLKNILKLFKDLVSFCFYVKCVALYLYKIELGIYIKC